MPHQAALAHSGTRPAIRPISRPISRPEVTELPAVYAELTYLRPGFDKPRRYAVAPPPGQPAWNGQDDPRVMPVISGRDAGEAFSLDVHGFSLLQAPTGFADFYSHEAVATRYYPEIEALLLRELGAERVVVFDHNVRNAARAAPGVREPVRRVHNDWSYRAAPQRVRDLLGAEAEAWLARRLVVVNAWRPISPVQESPLALCDARTIRDSDLVATDLVHADRVGETFSVAWSPRHRWFYFPHMQPDEVILIKGHDSLTDGRARLSFHTAFRDPLTPPNAPPRESIEVRCLAFLPASPAAPRAR